YIVTEVDSGDYTVSCTGDTGTIEVDSIVEAAFVNTPPDNPKTGDHTPFLPLLLLAQLALAGLLFLLYRRRRTA
ncbi:MAG: LPXTG cell wall anchor domain-containing protein, partial [Eubacterium sp.]|nr:LPXTG cell wall anchor domain-containing protein [Eubacterium sp.]